VAQLFQRQQTDVPLQQNMLPGFSVDRADGKRLDEADLPDRSHDHPVFLGLE